MTAAIFHGFESLVENSPDAISLIDEHGEVFYSSAGNTGLFGYKPAELVGRDCMERVHPEDRAHSIRSLQEVIVKAPGPQRWDARVRHKNGNYCWVESTVCNLLRDLEVQAIVMHQRDINDRRVAEEHRKQQAEDLIRSNLRMEEFAYTVAHDLREPLRAISIYTQLLVKEIPLGDKPKQMAQFLVASTGRMSRMVADLLSFAQTGKHGPARIFDLQHALDQALKNLDLEIEESGAVVTTAGLPIVCTDETHLVSLFQNLISNAIKYRREAPLRIYISAERQGSDWVIKVQDNGIGIAPEYQSKVFLPFVRLTNLAVRGTGLGLAVCKKIVEGLGGTIWLESEPGVGSTFAFTVAAEADVAGLNFANTDLT